MSYENKGTIPTHVLVTSDPDRSGNLITNGTADQVEINAAIGMLTSGRTRKEKVTLIGDFTLTAAIVVPSYTILEIVGTINVVGASTNNAIEFVGANGSELTHIEILGGDLIGTGAAYGGVATNQIGIRGAYTEHLLISGVRCYDWANFGIYLVRCPNNVPPHYSLPSIVENCSAENSTRDGFYIDGCYGIKMNGCHADTNDRYGFNLQYGPRYEIVNCKAMSNIDSGFNVFGARDCSIVNCIARNNGGSGFELGSDAGRGNTATGCTTEVNDIHGMLVSGSRWAIVGCNNHNNDQDAAGYSGVYVAGDYNTITGCVSQNVADTQDYGFTVYGGNYNTFVGCVAEGNNQYGFLIDADADSNTIKCCTTGGNDTGCVNIANANCDKNRVFDNDFDEGAIVNVGTNTQAFLNWDPSANAFIATINPPAIVGGGGGFLP